MKTMTEMKALIAHNLVTLKSNQGVATLLAGTEFTCENGRGEKVAARLLPQLSSHGKIQAELACSRPGCTKTHTRERSDWHQALLCRECRPSAGKTGHAAPKATTKSNLTPDQQIAQLKAALAAAEAQKAEQDSINAALYGE